MGKSWKVWTKLSIWDRRSTKGWTLRLKWIDASRAQCRYWKDLTCSGHKRGCQPNGKFKYLAQFVFPNSLYSLEALQPTEAAASKLDTFQLKGLRKIMKMSKTYIDRTNTNHEVYRRANLEMGLGAEEIIRPLSDVLQEKRRKVLGHIIRRPRDHPQQVEHRKVGRPRAAWTYETMKDCWRRNFTIYHFKYRTGNTVGKYKHGLSTEKILFDSLFFAYRTNSCCSGANGSHPDLWNGYRLKRT